MNVAILGASDKPARYAYKAMKRLEESGHQVFLVNPKLEKIEGHRVYPSLLDVPKTIHTLTVYVNSSISINLVEELKTLNAKRAIFNPGSENREIYQDLQSSGTAVEEACTLVLLNTEQF